MELKPPFLLARRAHQKLETPSPKPETRNLTPETQNLKPETLNASQESFRELRNRMEGSVSFDSAKEMRGKMTEQVLGPPPPALFKASQSSYLTQCIH